MLLNDIAEPTLLLRVLCTGSSASMQSLAS